MFLVIRSTFRQVEVVYALNLGLDRRLYKALLERSSPGLSMIPSTNTKDFTKLQPYLIDSISELTWGGQFIRKIKLRPLRFFLERVLLLECYFS